MTATAWLVAKRHAAAFAGEEFKESHCTHRHCREPATDMQRGWLATDDHAGRLDLGHLVILEHIPLLSRRRRVYLLLVRLLYLSVCLASLKELYQFLVNLHFSGRLLDCLLFLRDVQPGQTIGFNQGTP